MKKVFLITKLKTTNVGNQALSEEIIKLFLQEVGEQSLCVFGRPMGLDGYTPNRVESTEDPVKRFEEWADSIISHFKGQLNDKIAFKPRIPQVELIGIDQSKLRFESVKASLRPIKRFLSRFRPYNKAYERRLHVIDTCEWMVYSGAGEVGDNNVFLRQLLELRVAQKLGKKTAAVNQSVVIKTIPFQKLVGYVYGKMDRIVVRGEISKRNLISYGVMESLFRLAPDTALSSGISKAHITLPGEAISKPVVGINFTRRISFDLQMIGTIIGELQSFGKEVVFLTNEPYEDAMLGHKVEKRFGVRFISTKYPYQEYVRILSQLEYLISTRLHSNILALVAQTPIIPIEGNIFKTTELLAQIECPVNVINSSDDNWSLRVVEEIRKMEKRSYDWHSYFTTILPKHILKVQENASWLKDYDSK